MTLAIILALLAVAVPPVLIWMAKGRIWSSRSVERIQPVDLEAFRNLIDPEEEEFLRVNLPAADFRKIQRERLRAAVEYISCARDNAAVLLHLAEPARRSTEPAVAEAAARLINDAVSLRLYALLVIPKLYVGMVLPGRPVIPVRVADRYEQLTRQVARLGLRTPAADAAMQA